MSHLRVYETLEGWYVERVYPDRVYRVGGPYKNRKSDRALLMSNPGATEVHVEPLSMPIAAEHGEA